MDSSWITGHPESIALKVNAYGAAPSAEAQKVTHF